MDCNFCLKHPDFVKGECDLKISSVGMQCDGDNCILQRLDKKLDLLLTVDCNCKENNDSFISMSRSLENYNVWWTCPIHGKQSRDKQQKA